MSCPELGFGYFEIGLSDMNGNQAVLRELGGSACQSEITKVG